MGSLLLLEKKNSIAILKINRPKSLNALNRDVVDELDHMLDAIKDDSTVRALVVTGDNNFAAGADVTSMAKLTPQEAHQFLFAPTFNKLEQLPIPTIAAIKGFALGGGLELALCCDFRIAGEDAQMGFPEINLGIMPGAGGTVRLPRVVGIGKAKELIFTGRRLHAVEACQIGLVEQVVSVERVLDAACELADNLSKKSGTALRTAKSMLNCSLSLPVEGALKLESSLWAGLFGTDDQCEGMQAFVEKRKPKFL